MAPTNNQDLQTVAEIASYRGQCAFKMLTRTDARTSFCNIHHRYENPLIFVVIMVYAAAQLIPPVPTMNAAQIYARNGFSALMFPEKPHVHVLSCKLAPRANRC